MAGKKRTTDRPARYVADQDKGGNWRFRVRARGNGRIVGPTEGYTGSPSKVLRAIAAMERAVDEARKHPVLFLPRRGRTLPLPLRPRRS